jgi:hypothetical protein
VEVTKDRPQRQAQRLCKSHDFKEQQLWRFHAKAKARLPLPHVTENTWT